MPTARLRSRRTKTMPANEWPADRKIGLVLEGLRGQRTVAELCREAGISTTRYDQWRQEFLDTARTGIANTLTHHHALNERIRQLEAENTRLQAQVRIFRDLAVAD